jgi:hypothetical protein
MGANNSSQQLQNQIFNMKFTAKQLARESSKCEKAMEKEKKQVGTITRSRFCQSLLTLLFCFTLPG